MRASGSATADASVMAPSPFAVKLSVGAVGAVEPIGGGWALSQEVVMWVKVLGGGAVGGGAAACSPTVSQESAESPLASSLASPMGGLLGKPGGRPGPDPAPRLSRAGEGRRPRNRVAGEGRRDLDLERGLELPDSVAGTGIAARVRALARPSTTTPRPWVYEAGPARAWRCEPHVCSEAT